MSLADGGPPDIVDDVASFFNVDPAAVRAAVAAADAGDPVPLRRFGVVPTGAGGLVDIEQQLPHVVGDFTRCGDP